MSPTKDEIKKWLKNIGQDREWLANQCWVAKRSVDEWLSSRGVIPPIKMEKIKNLMNGNLVQDEVIPYEIQDEFEEFVREKAKMLHQSIDQFVLDILEEHLKNK